MTLGTLDRTQLFDSVLKLMHYTASFTTVDLDLEFYYGNEHFGGASFPAPRSIAFSSSLFTRIDACHGAGNCCRVSFDLVYSRFDRDRIIGFDVGAAAKDYGELSAKRFEVNRERLLANLEPVKVVVNNKQSFNLFVLRNRDVNPISGNTSCPFLFMGKDRYYCGVHVFKPLHCWMPHMTVRATETTERERPSISVGRNQYGRNHKFGCPVQFIASKVAIPGMEKVNDNYFEPNGQFDSDYAKLQWLSNSTASMGFTRDSNRAVDIHSDLKAVAPTIWNLLTQGANDSITIWERGVTSLT